MRAVLFLVLAASLAPVGLADEVTIEGLVYNRTRLLESEAAPPPAPEAFGVPGARVLIFGVAGTDEGHARGMTDERGLFRMEIEVADDPHARPDLQAIVVYNNIQYPFLASAGGRIEIPVYEPTTDREGIRVVSHRITLARVGDPPTTVSVHESIRILNEGKGAFTGFAMAEGVPGLLATIRASVAPHELSGELRKARMRLRPQRLPPDIAAFTGYVLPTGTEPEEIHLKYDFHLGEGAGVQITRPIYYDSASIRIVYPRDLEVRPPEGFSEPMAPAGEEGAGSSVIERTGASAGGEMTFSVLFASNRPYWLLGGFGTVFLVALGLAILAGRRGIGATEPAASVEPIARSIARLDIRNARGEIDPGLYAREREALLREAMAGRAIDAGGGSPSVSSEVARLLDKIDALEKAGGEDAVKEGKRQAYVEEILDALRRQRAAGSGGGSADG